jgi:N-acyl-phosphatidylethanolamine-hydrolysing phospholipase D
MQALRALAVFSCVALSACFPLRAVQRNLAAPKMRALPNKVTDPRRADARLAVLWVGHATVLIQMDDVFVLTDPVFTRSLALVSPRLVEPGISPENLPPLAAVIVSHMHFDHLSFASLDMVEKRTPVVLVAPGVRSSMPRYSFEIREMSRWASYERGGLRITAVPVQHVGGRYGIDQAWNPEAFTGYVLEYHGLSVYFGGDTAYAPDAFRATRARFPTLDVAFLPICPDEPRDYMAPTHESPGQALAAFGLLGARTLVPIHFDTYINSDDAVGACPASLRRLAHARGYTDEQVAVLRIGEQRVFIPRQGARTADQGPSQGLVSGMPAVPGASDQLPASVLPRPSRVPFMSPKNTPEKGGVP